MIFANKKTTSSQIRKKPCSQIRKKPFFTNNKEAIFTKKEAIFANEKEMIFANKKEPIFANKGNFNFLQKACKVKVTTVHASRNTGCDPSIIKAESKTHFASHAGQKRK